MEPQDQPDVNARENSLASTDQQDPKGDQDFTDQRTPKDVQELTSQKDSLESASGSDENLIA